MRFSSLVFFIFATLTFGCIYMYPSEVQKAIHECDNLSDWEFEGYHGLGGCVYYRAYCISDVAIKYENPAICEEAGLLISSVDESSRCSVDADALKDMCYLHVARSTANPEPCDKIKSVGEKWYCITETDGDYGLLFDLCPKQDEMGVRECQYNLISQSKDASLCLGIDNYDEAKDCIASFAWEFHDSSICSLLEDERDVGLCKAQWD